MTQKEKISSCLLIISVFLSGNLHRGGPAETDSRMNPGRSDLEF